MTQGGPESAGRSGRRLLCVFAHPDDEAYGPGGTIARCAMEGVEVAVLTLTCGEAGTIGVSRTLPRDELCRRRRAEVAVACGALGVARHRVVGVPDGAVADVDPDWGRDLVVEEIRAFRPQVLLTFHHEGVSGHPDHIAVAGWLEAAFDALAGGPDAPGALFGWGIPRPAAALYRRDRLFPIPDAEIDARVEIPDGAMARKIEAIRRHRTQIAFFEQLQDAFDYAEVMRPECFHARRGPRPSAGRPYRDLFEAVGAAGGPGGAGRPGGPGGAGGPEGEGGTPGGGGA